jgi:tRNA threonylcarbamoyl adenosine modification protein YjeE
MTPLPDIAATEALAQKIAPLLQTGDFLALRGDLGAGKTSFARALLRALGAAGDMPSPTFTLLQTYETARFPVAHFDLYRLKSPGELDELGWDDALTDGVTLVEWPERAGNRLPEQGLFLYFDADRDGRRQCRIEAHGDWPQRLKGTSL